MSGGVVNVLVVDDSAVVRQTMLALLAGQDGFEVAVAADPLIAARRMAERRPDVIVLDLEMPRMDGLTFLRRLMAEDPIPVVVCSTFAPGTGRAAIDALEDGAIDVITKPALGVQGFLLEQALAIVETLEGAARARLTRGPRALPAQETRPAPPAASAAADHHELVIALGASTGGTEALRAILGGLPREMPGILIVQHMPEGFTRAFAERLDHLSAIEVREARDADRLHPGLALVAPGDRHLALERDARGYRVSVTEGPLVSRHRPSVDVLFHSVATAAGPRALGGILTGMGADGASGLLAMRRQGASTIAQDEASCVVFGMPRQAVRCGAVERSVRLSMIPEALREFRGGPGAARGAARLEP
jgi:two-component system, chemotaxis family, protein-glutamate methylesterase/glutaminase